MWTSQKAKHTVALIRYASTLSRLLGQARLMKLDYKDIASKAKPSVRGWLDKIDEESRKALEEVRRQWQAADKENEAPPALTFAHGLKQACDEQGILVPKKKGLAEWLKQGS